MEIAIILMLGLLVGAYLLGAVPTSYLLGRWVLGIDLSQEGSGNLGASNLARRSPALGGVALLLDAAKGWLPAAAGLRLAPGAGLAAGLAFAAVVGHCWSIYRWRAPQKGGKGVATLCGALLALVPWL
ncbi:MAG TPA: glycerol-3-phosphate acyltransferase, partial [Chloroflexia bacterium]|nr:glycerol-3-phosphate acyltransferase [Chloroflexia bacterium]